MRDASEEELEEELVQALLAPLAQVRPVALRRSRAARRWRRPTVIGAGVAALLALVGGGMAAAGAFGPLHGAVLRAPAPDISLNGTNACQLVGQTAAQADKVLTENGYRVEWRFMHWGSQLIPAQVSTTVGPSASGPTTTSGTTPAPAGAVAGYESSPTTVPGDSVVWQLFSDTGVAKTVLVFVEAPHDPDAPTIETPSCSTTSS